MSSATSKQLTGAQLLLRWPRDVALLRISNIENMFVSQFSGEIRREARVRDHINHIKAKLEF